MFWLTSHFPGMMVSLFQPNNGGMLMTPDRIQTAAIMAAMRAGVLFMAYSNGRLMTKYLSTLIAQRLRMDAVQSRTSSDVQTSQTVCPSTHRPPITYITTIIIEHSATFIHICTALTAKMLNLNGLHFVDH